MDPYGNIRVVPVTEIDDTTELLHFRILAKLGKVLFTMCTFGYVAERWNCSI